jgi:uncharacterized protein (DUF924 family)
MNMQSLNAIRKVHEFWFGADYLKDPLKNRKMWWHQPDGIDDLIRKEFTEVLDLANSGQCDSWPSLPNGLVSLIVLLDQFPRHIFRGTSQAFAYDSKALALCKKSLDSDRDYGMEWVERQFFLMPLEHSENLEDQKRAVEEFKKLIQDTPREFKDYMKDNSEYALKHFVIIERFGRFPHRNEILGRPSTPEEIEFLKQPGNRF